MKRIFTIIAAFAAIVSCQKEQEQVSDEISFDLSIPATKATATGFENGDQVALYAVEYAGDEAPELQIGGNFINNEKLTYNGSKWAAASKLYWSDKPCDFYALYPYQELISVEEHKFEVQPDQNGEGYEASDLLFAKAEKIERAAGQVSLQFNHIMSKCVVTLTKGDEFEGEIPNDVVAHIYNTTTSAVLDFANGSLQKDPEGSRKTITMKKLSNERFEAVVVPQNIERRTPLIEITMGGIAYLLEYSLSFKPGHEHTINLILNTSPDQENFEISIDASVDNMN